MHQYLTKIDPTANMRRFYSVTVQATLLGEFCLIRRMGRIGRSVRILPPVVFVDAEAAQRAAERLVARKKRRGYQAE